METSPQAPPQKRVVRSFEIDSFEWWKRSGVWIVGILVLVTVMLVTTPQGGCGKPAAITQAVNNARQIGFALSDFQSEYGSYPNADTAGKIRDKTGSDLKLGTHSSNDFFRQLLASGITENEAMFYAKIQDCRKPDNVITGSKALEKGECAFTYLKGAFVDCNPYRPIAVTQMIPGTDRFDPKPFKGKAIVLRADNSVTAMHILTKYGHIMLEGRNLMDPAHPVWDGKPPAIAWPEL
jgi:hypothetical protein